jgi:hypothetical protein
LFGTTVKTADLQMALKKAGVSDQRVPSDWDGAQLILHTRPAVLAEWHDLTLMQSRPPILSMPAAFDLGEFATAVLRAVGMDRAAAQQFGRGMAASPALFLGITTEDKVKISDVKLRTGPATLIEDFDDRSAPQRVTLIWVATDRVYVLSGAVTLPFAVAVANAVE